MSKPQTPYYAVHNPPEEGPYIYGPFDGPKEGFDFINASSFRGDRHEWSLEFPSEGGGWVALENPSQE